MGHTDPELTVVLVAWDIAGELEECLESLAAQDFPHSLVLVDNCSHTALPEVPSTPWKRTEKRLTIGAARNFGLTAVVSPLVMFMDADDVVLPDALNRLVAQLTTSPHLVSVAGAIVAWDPVSNSRELAVWPFPYTRRLQQFPRVFALWNAVRDVFPVTGTVVHRTDAVRRAGGFGDVNWAEDWSLGVPLCFAGPVRTLEEPTILYRTSPQHQSLSDVKEGRWGPSWLGRTEARRALCRGADVPRWMCRVAPFLVIPHLWFSLRDLKIRRQRVST